MIVHHINGATMCPFGGRLISGERGVRANLACHCLIIETGNGLVLVDTGMGRSDVAQAVERLGRPYLALTRPRLDPEETVHRQVERLGFHADDVRHIVLTHLDVDHAGGLGDFPRAKVHLHAAEHRAALERRSRRERRRYLPAHWAHRPDFVTYEPDGERWFGIECVRPLESLPPEILLVPLVGHTRGHSAVAVETPEGWLLHCGDAYFHRGEIAPEPHCPLGLRLFGAAVQMDSRLRRASLERLRRLAREHGDEVRIFCSHDPVELEALRR